MPKKYYPGGFRLTKKTAAALAVRELGTARGLEAEPGMPEGYFHITFGNMDVPATAAIEVPVGLFNCKFP